MEENKNKIAEVEKLSDEELENVAGGTDIEAVELWGAVGENINNGGFLKKDGWNNFNVGFYTLAGILDDYGIEANVSRGTFNLGLDSVNNTYRDMKTGQFLLHKEVVDFVKTGKKSWIK